MTDKIGYRRWKSIVEGNRKDGRFPWRGIQRGKKKRNPAKDSKKKSVRCNGVRIPRYGGAGGGKGLGVGNVKRKERGREDDKAESGIRKTT